MAKLSAPESVKVAIAGQAAPDTNVNAIRVPIIMGKNEVAIVLAVRAIDSITTGTHNHIANWALWKKSDETWPEADLKITSLAKNSDILIAGSFVTNTATQGGKGYKSVDDFIFPYPQVLLRPPQFLYQYDSQTGQKIGIMVYYVIQEVKDAELARLMVKDHA